MPLKTSLAALSAREFQRQTGEPVALDQLRRPLHHQVLVAVAALHVQLLGQPPPEQLLDDMMLVAHELCGGRRLGALTRAEVAALARRVLSRGV